MRFLKYACHVLNINLPQEVYAVGFVSLFTWGGIHKHRSVKIRSNLSKNDQLLIRFLDQQRLVFTKHLI